MAFNDYPIVDDSAKASENSVLAVRCIFKKENGFISREPTPDYGVDFEVELIMDGNAVSGWQFPIQIKSSQNLEVILHEQKKYVSYSFKTSRIGYLCRRAPTYGIIIIYDDKNDMAYYDYVEKIVLRIKEQRGSDDWKQQDNVTINIPLENVLSEGKVLAVHKKLCVRFQNHQTMISSHGQSYDIPSFFEKTGQENIDFNSSEGIASFLGKYGMALFNRQDFLFIDNLLSKLNTKEINDNPQLLFIAAITYQNIGKFIEAEYFIKKALSQDFGYSNDEKCILVAAQLQVSYVFGNIAAQKYLLDLSDLLSKGVDKSIRIIFLLQTISLKLALCKVYEKEFAEIFDDINAVLSLLEECSISDDFKNHYKVGLGAHLLLMMIFMYGNAVGTIKIKEAAFPVSIEERLLIAKTLTSLLKAAFGLFKEALDYAIEKNDVFLQASVCYSKGSSMCMFNLYSAMWKNTQFIRKEECKLDLKGVLFAYNYFIKNGFIERAYKALTTVYDINKLYRYLFSQDAEIIDESKIKEDIIHLQKTVGITKPFSLVDDFLNDIAQSEQIDVIKDIVDMTDEDIGKFASDMVRCWGLPKERLENVKADLYFMKKAYQAIEGTNFDLGQNLEHTKSVETLYKDTLLYVLRCTKCGFQTRPSNNLDELLHDKKINHPHVCL